MLAQLLIGCTLLLTIKNTFAASDDVYPPQHTNQLQAVQQAVPLERESKPALIPAQIEAGFKKLIDERVWGSPKYSAICIDMPSEITAPITSNTPQQVGETQHLLSSQVSQTPLTLPWSLQVSQTPVTSPSSTVIHLTLTSRTIINIILELLYISLVRWTSTQKKKAPGNIHQTDNQKETPPSILLSQTNSSIPNRSFTKTTHLNTNPTTPFERAQSIVSNSKQLHHQLSKFLHHELHLHTSLSKTLRP